MLWYPSEDPGSMWETHLYWWLFWLALAALTWWLISRSRDRLRSEPDQSPPIRCRGEGDNRHETSCRDERCR
jgi:hypothetical protein